MLGLVGRAAIVVAIAAEEDYGQGFVVAGAATAAGRVAVGQPGLMERPAAHLAGGTMGAVQLFVADDAENGAGYLECGCHFTTSRTAAAAVVNIGLVCDSIPFQAV